MGCDVNSNENLTVSGKNWVVVITEIVDSDAKYYIEIA